MDSYDLELYHHGVLGMHWGVRNFQNTDGSLKSAGQIHRYASSSIKSGMSFIKSNASAKYVDTMDVLNRKGVLDFLDSKANAPFDAIKSSDTKYFSESKKDAFRAMSNMDRYLDMSAYARTKNGMDIGENRKIESGMFKKMMDSYTKNGEVDSWVNGVLNRTGQSVEDKKLGMVSKDARDIERYAAGKELMKQFTGKNFDISKASSRWYKTDVNGHDPRFTGERWVKGKPYKEMVPHIEEIIHPGYEKQGHYRYFKMPGDTRPGIKGANISKEHYDADKIYKWNDKGYVDIPYYTNVPERKERRQNGWEERTVTPILGESKEFIDYRKGLDMPKDYAHMTDAFQRSYDLGASYANSFYHDELNHVGEYLAHHGTKGMHWGVRNFQNADGSLTPMGRVRYGVGAARKAAQKGAAAAANAIRRKIKPTDEEKMAYIQKKQAKADLNAQYRMAKGKDIKDPSKLSDQELARQLQRKRAEEEYNKLMGKGDSSLFKMAAKSVKENAARAVGDLAKDAITKRGQDLLKSREERAYEDAKMEADTIANRLKAHKDADELLYRNTNEGRAAEQAKRSRDYYNDSLEAQRKKEDLEYQTSDAGRSAKNIERMRDNSKMWRDIAENEAARAKTSQGKSYAERMKEESQIAKDRRDATLYNLERSAYRGNRTSANTIDMVAKAKKGGKNKKSQETSDSGSNNNYEAKHMKESKKKNKKH